MPHRFAAPALGLACGVAAVGIHLGWFGPLHVLLRDWVMHFLALFAAALLTSSILLALAHAPARSYRGLVRLGVLVPLGISCAHELGQWLWPAGARDTFDCSRDFLLNVAGAVAAFRLLRRWQPADPAAPRRRAAPAAGQP